LNALTKVFINHPQVPRPVEIERCLGVYGEQGNGPTLMITAGIHGNEPAGIFAFLEFLDELRAANVRIEGQVIGLAGNLPALEQGVRFIDRDLNRVWQHVTPVEADTIGIDPPATERPPSSASEVCAELIEKRELSSEIERILKTARGSVFCLDLHTTSSDSIPFVPFDDTLRNREFVEQIPCVAILGIEEFLPGTLLSYLNQFGVVALGFEAGKHDDPVSIEIHKSMLWIALAAAGCLRADDPNVVRHRDNLRRLSGGKRGFFEIRYRYAIQDGEGFRMKAGFRSFQPITIDEQLAENSAGPIRSHLNGFLFMPLYQALGDDGFFIVRPVARFWLWLSKWVRLRRLDSWLVWLPGVRWDPQDHRNLLVNPKVARFIARQIFHLLGYRKLIGEGPEWCFQRREP
jgi:predicted deacylase